MKAASTYIHALEGRLRIKIPVVKGDPSQAWELEREMQLMEGIEKVSANAITGNVLILYDPALIKNHQIISRLLEMGYLDESFLKSGEESVVEKVTTTLASTLMELALTRLVTALI